MRDFVRTTLIWVLVAFLGDTVLAPAIAIRGISPDFSVIALVILALAAGATPGTAGGFVIGLVQDVSNPQLLGLHALCKCGLGFALGKLRSRLVYGMPIVEAVMLMLSVLAHDLLFLLVRAGLGTEASPAPFFLQSIPVALYTAAVGVPLLRILSTFGVLNPED